jgi:hypothetical protein
VSDIFREVDEEIRKERYLSLWKKYGPWVIGAAVALVLAVAGWQGWQQWQRSQAIEASKAYDSAVDALQAGDTETALSRLSELSDPRASGYGLLAAFRRAELLSEQGDAAGAIQTWDRIAASPEAPAPLTDLATIFSVMHQLDDGAPEQLASRLQPIADGGSAMRWTAVELQAYLAQRGGDAERARDLYGRIADASDVPPAQRQRATQMLALLEG